MKISFINSSLKSLSPLQYKGVGVDEFKVLTMQRIEIPDIPPMIDLDSKYWYMKRLVAYEGDIYWKDKRLYKTSNFGCENQKYYVSSEYFYSKKYDNPNLKMKIMSY